jgi:hypothetical protein
MLLMALRSPRTTVPAAPLGDFLTDARFRLTSKKPHLASKSPATSTSGDVDMAKKSTKRPGKRGC